MKIGSKIRIVSIPESVMRMPPSMRDGKGDEIIAKLKGMKLSEAAKILQEGLQETLTYMRFPREHWKRIRTNNALERMNREIRRRTRVVGNFPDGRSALRLVSAQLRYISTTNWGQKRYLDMNLLITGDANESAA